MEVDGIMIDPIFKKVVRAWWSDDYAFVREAFEEARDAGWTLRQVNRVGNLLGPFTIIVGGLLIFLIGGNLFFLIRGSYQ